MRISRMSNVVAVAGLLGVFLLPPSVHAQTRELRYTDWGPDQGIRGEALKWFDSELRRRTNDELGLKFFWGGVLLGPSNAMQGISAGTADIGSATPPYEPGVIVSWQAADVPQISDEWVGLRSAYDLMTTHPAALDEFEEQGLRYVSNMTTGPMQLVSTDPVRTIDDLKGKKIRATGKYVQVFDSMGATGVGMSNSESYQALATNAVDGTSGYWYAIPAYKWYEVADYVTELNLGQFLAFGMVINQQVYESLTDEQQTILNNLGRDFIDHMAEKVYSARVDVRENLRSGTGGVDKMEIVQADDELRNGLLTTAEEVGMSWLGKAEKKNLPGEDLLASFQEHVNRYSKIRDEQGYPWGD